MMIFSILGTAISLLVSLGTLIAAPFLAIADLIISGGEPWDLIHAAHQAALWCWSAVIMIFPL
ncbi:MAG: hypothetical protein LBR73_04325 [Oscillospiraceae bacterium]|jgi:hypothetical protein|nr:hypothetical protein [Oscillospiraceae bacterium]